MKTETKPDPDPKFAWAQVERADAPKRPATARVSDFMEIYGFLDEESARQQAMRCIQCPEPTCVEGCPLNNRIPEWMALTAEGRFGEASQLLQASSCMEDVFSRLCSHPCEARCILEGRADPVAINAIERFLHDYGFAHGVVDVALAPLNGFRVAIYDSGPCGLTCAYDLARRGYSVTIFDAAPTAGGLLAQSVPAFRMDRGVLQRRLGVLEKLGVKFRLGTTLGKDVTLGHLRQNYDAVFLGASIGEPRALEIPGANLRGMHGGLSFIVERNLPGDQGQQMSVTDRRVVVLGGGDVAMDCLRVALRSGAREAVCLYRRGEADLPCSRTEFENAREEGAKFEFHTLAVELLGDVAGNVTGVRCVRTEPGAPDASGRPQPLPVAGPDLVVPAEMVLVCHGFRPLAFHPGGDFEQLDTTPDGHLVVDDQQRTNLPGVFAGGAFVHDSGVFLDAVREARKAAAAIDAQLMPASR